MTRIHQNEINYVKYVFIKSMYYPILCKTTKFAHHHDERSNKVRLETKHKDLVLYLF